MLKKKIKIDFGKVSLIMLAVFAVLLTADLVTKYCAEVYSWEFKVIPGLIEVVPLRHNPGAAFSFLADKEWGQAVLTAVAIIMLCALVPAFLFIPDRMVAMKIAVIMVISGAVGNLIDRMMFLNLPLAERGVRDFVNVNMFGKWACCNFADFWIVFGVIIAAVDLLFLNEWAVFPLTKKARAAQAKKDEAEQPKTDETVQEPTETDETVQEPTEITDDKSDKGE